MLPRSQRRQMRTAAPHRAHVNPRVWAAATTPASRGLYKSRDTRHSGAGYPVHRATAAGDQEARDVTPGLHPQNLCLTCHTSCVEAIGLASPGRATSDKQPPGGSRERLSTPVHKFAHVLFLRHFAAGTEAGVV